jgi:L-asparagine transporter-like permease
MLEGFRKCITYSKYRKTALFALNVLSIFYLLLQMQFNTIHHHTPVAFKYILALCKIIRIKSMTIVGIPVIVMCKNDLERMPLAASHHGL